MFLITAHYYDDSEDAWTKPLCLVKDKEVVNQLIVCFKQTSDAIKKRYADYCLINNKIKFLNWETFKNNYTLKLNFIPQEWQQDLNKYLNIIERADNFSYTKIEEFKP